MATGTARLQLFLELKNRLRTGLNSTRNQVDRAVGGMQNRLSRFAASNTRMFDAIKTQIPGVGSALGMLSNPYTAIAAAAVGAGVAIVKCTQEAIKWEKSMADIQVTAQLTKKELGNLSDYLKKMGTEVAVELDDIPKAFSMILGAVNDLQGSKDLLKPTMMAAKAFGGSLESTAEALSSVFSSTGRDGERLGDILAQSLIDGAVEFEQYAQFFPKMLPSANALGLKLEEIAGTYSALTGKLGARASATTLDALFGELQSAEKLKKLKKIGVNVFDKEGSIRSLQEIVGDFKKQFDGLSDEKRALKFSNLGLSDNAAKAILSLTQNYDDMARSIESATNSQGALEKAYKNSLTATDVWILVKNNLKIGMIEIGNIFLPFVKLAGEKLLEIIDWVKKLWNENQILRDRVALLGKTVKVCFMIMFAPVKQFYNMLKFVFNIIGNIISELGKFAAKITGTGDSFSDLYNKVRPYLLWIYELLSQIGDIFYKLITFDFSGAWDSVKNFKLPSIDEIKARVVTETEIAETEPTQAIENDDTDKTTKNDDTTTITKGSQTKIINVTIGKIVESWQTLNPEFRNMGKAEVEAYLTTIVTRAIQSLMMTK
jgi:TP901 family phage tail tape measure protein